ncbi:MAG: hypothetical protein SXA11_00480 [Cyanobacteriota bacterium]|nr:hypothetical protein [Cyanobacteriota bacterium]
MPVLREQARCLFYGNRQDACSTVTGKMPVLLWKPNVRFSQKIPPVGQASRLSNSPNSPVGQASRLSNSPNSPVGQASRLFYGNRQDACSTETGKMPVLRKQARCLFYGNHRQDACSTETGKMPVLREPQARCLFYGNHRQDACSTEQNLLAITQLLIINY